MYICTHTYVYVCVSVCEAYAMHNAMTRNIMPPTNT